MTGIYEHSIDSAGRLIVPAKLREKLGKTFYLAASGKGNLTLYPMEAWNTFRQHVAELPQADADEFDLFFALAQECETDKQWRFQVPGYLKEYAGLDRDVVFTGNNDRAQLWSAESWAARRKKATPADIAELMAKFRV